MRAVMEDGFGVDVNAASVPIAKPEGGDGGAATDAEEHEEIVRDGD